MDANRNEYLAAAAGMNDIYGTPYKHGDRIAFRLAGWSETSWDAGNVINTHAGKLLVETDTDIVEVDPRPWPIGNVLPF